MKIIDTDGREITHYCVTRDLTNKKHIHIQWADLDHNFYPLAEAKDHNITDTSKEYGKFVEV